MTPGVPTAVIVNPAATAEELEEGESDWAVVAGLSETQFLIRCTELSKLLYTLVSVSRNAISPISQSEKYILDVCRVHLHECGMRNESLCDGPCHF